MRCQRISGGDGGGDCERVGGGGGGGDYGGCGGHDTALLPKRL